MAKKQKRKTKKPIRRQNVTPERKLGAFMRKVGGVVAPGVIGALRNPAKRLKRVTKSSGWLKADAVRFVKKGGRVEVYIRRNKPRRKKAR